MISCGSSLLGRYRQPLAGWFVAAGLLLMIARILGADLSPAWPGVAYGVASVLLWPRLARRNRIQSLVLLALGTLCLLWSQAQGTVMDPERLLAGNSALLSMLVAVSFLGLVSQPAEQQDERLPRGRRAVGTTLMAVHLFGAVINLSAIFIIGDRLARRRALNREQVLVLVRGFSGAALWSPFFAAMAVALSFAPDARLSAVWLVSIPLAALSLLLAFWLQGRAEGTDKVEFTGYPMHYGALWLPLLLAAVVFVMHRLYPALSVLAVITVLTPLLTLLVLPWRSREPLGILNRQISGRLPQMANELMLFQCAGVLGYGLELLVSGMGGGLSLNGFGAFEASLCYGAIVLLSLVGVHPIISIAFVGSLLAPLEPDHTLLALAFLASWSLGAVVGPLSGMNLAVQGRYGVDSFQIMRWNLGYLTVMSLLVVAALYLLERTL
ncbi:hypothetical protein [Zobellella maritima]|uniref:hypothetical protein n=1 Tax=Zobellella maritima TaxID=2059725 RepID=UPI000E300201|nr:hypothetical protein [Zobellella maritima]